MLLSGSSSYGHQQEKKASELFAQRALQERRLKPPDQVVACPRCQSLNTKFCYYNNYSLTQPRHFCKNCRRYWTAGGTLRNVPVGGGCRKNKQTKHTSRHTDAAAAPQRSSAAAGIIGAGHRGSLDQSNNNGPREAIAGLQQHSPFASASSTLFDSNDHEAITFEPSQHTATTGAAAPDMHESGDDLELPFRRPHTNSSLGALHHHHHHHHHSSQPQQFETPSIMNLGLFNSVLPDTGLSMHSSSSSHHQHPHHVSTSTGDSLSVILDSSTYNRVGAFATLTEGLNSNSNSSSSSSSGSGYNHLHSNGPVSSGDAAHETLQATARTELGGWTNLQLPKHEPSLWVEEDSFLHGSLDLNRLHAKGKFLTPALFSHLPTAAGLGEDAAAAAQGASGSPAAAAWQQQSASQKDILPHYEFNLDTNFWSNSNNSSSSPWSHLDLHTLHGLGGGGGGGRLL